MKQGPYARSRDLRLIAGALVAVVLVFLICVI